MYFTTSFFFPTEQQMCFTTCVEHRQWLLLLPTVLTLINNNFCILINVEQKQGEKNTERQSTKERMQKN